jgi:hypothetical protein
MNFHSKMYKKIHILGVLLALVFLLVFVTGVVSDLHHLGPGDDARCPYCHLGHQTPVGLEAAPSTLSLKQIAFLLLPEDIVSTSTLIFSQAAPRAPPAA